MHALFIPNSEYQWARFKIKIELKYLHLLCRLYANKALFKYADYWHTIELRTPGAFYFTIYLPQEKHQTCRRDLYEQIRSIQQEYVVSNSENEQMLDLDSMINEISEDEDAGIVTVVPMADIPFESKMSATITKCLKNETIDHDTILGLAIYMHFILINYAGSLLNISKEECLERFYSSHRSKFNLNKDLVNSRYRENQLVLHQIVHEVFFHAEPASESWDAPIHDLFKREMYSRRFAKHSLDIPGFKLWNYPERINLILGLNSDDIQLLYYFIMKSLNFSNG